MKTPSHLPVVVRPTEPGDFQAIHDLSRIVYPDDHPWREHELTSHRSVFPEGQHVAVAPDTGAVIGMTASLLVTWDDYDLTSSYRDFTDGFMFTNHDPSGRTLYGAEVMVHPDARGQGVGKALYAARRELVRRLELRRIRAGARLRGYHRYASEMSAEAYVLKVVRGELTDPTLTFQLKQRFRVIGVAPDYLRKDPESLGNAAVIEWINHAAARRPDYTGRDPRFRRRPRPGPT